MHSLPIAVPASVTRFTENSFSVFLTAERMTHTAVLITFSDTVVADIPRVTFTTSEGKI